MNYFIGLLPYWVLGRNAVTVVEMSRQAGATSRWECQGCDLQIHISNHLQSHVNAPIISERMPWTSKGKISVWQTHFLLITSPATLKPSGIASLNKYYMPYIRSVKQIKQTLHFLRVRSEATTRVLVFPPVNNYHRFLIHKVSPWLLMLQSSWIWLYCSLFNCLWG